MSKQFFFGQFFERKCGERKFLSNFWRITRVKNFFEPFFERERTNIFFFRQLFGRKLGEQNFWAIFGGKQKEKIFSEQFLERKRAKRFFRAIFREKRGEKKFLSNFWRKTGNFPGQYFKRKQAKSFFSGNFSKERSKRKFSNKFARDNEKKKKNSRQSAIIREKTIVASLFE